MNPRLRYLAGTLAIVAVALGYALMQARPVHQPLARPASAGRPAPPPSPAPTARDILAGDASLFLTAEQKTRLEDLDRRWREDSAPLEASLREAERNFSRFMAEAQKAGRATLQEIQGRSGDVRELSAALRELRRLHSEAAANVLTEAQRQRLAALHGPVTPGGAR